MLSGLLNTYEKKDFENFVTDFTPGFFRWKGVKTGEKGRSSSYDYKFSNDIGFQGVKIFRVCLCVSQSKIWSLCSHMGGIYQYPQCYVIPPPPPREHSTGMNNLLSGIPFCHEDKTIWKYSGCNILLMNVKFHSGEGLVTGKFRALEIIFSYECKRYSRNNIGESLLVV